MVGVAWAQKQVHAQMNNLANCEHEGSMGEMDDGGVEGEVGQILSSTFRTL